MRAQVNQLQAEMGIIEYDIKQGILSVEYQW